MTNDKKSEAVEPEIVSQPDSYHYEKGSWNIGKIFWGLLLVLIGSLALASNFGLVDLNWSNLWRLWPLFVISAGLSIISLRNVLWRIIMVIFTLFTLAAIAWVMVGDYPNILPVHTYNTTVQQTSVNVKQAEVTIKAGASSLNIGTAKQDSVVESSLRSNIATISETSVVTGDNQQVNLTMDVDNDIWWNGNVKSTWDIDLSRSLPLRLNVDAGASDTNIDMSLAQLLAINIKAGASNLVLKLGSIESITDVSIESGVSSVTVKVPTGSGVQVKLENGLTSNSLADLTKTSENTYQSSDYANAAKKINIITKIGVSSFTVERY